LAIKEFKDIKVIKEFKAHRVRSALLDIRGCKDFKEMSDRSAAKVGKVDRAGRD
jgi:hypothetical protein